MGRSLGRTFLAAVVAGSLWGCIVHHHDGPEPAPGGIAVNVNCHHHEGCGHYWYNGSWYAQHGHVHGPDCGHYFHGGRWVLSGPTRVARDHVCDLNCNHYVWDGHWYAVRHHRHGAGCGHVLRDGAWVGVRF